MKRGRISQLIVFATICWIILIFFQVSWIKHSHHLAEEQFDQKVTLSLCHAISYLNITGEISCTRSCEAFPQNLVNNGSYPPEGSADSRAIACSDSAILNAMTKALNFYNIDMDFQLSMVSKKDSGFDPESPYLCSMLPAQANNDQYLSLHFPHKSRYLMGQIWFMLVSSIAILLIILLIFLLTMQALLKHKRFSNFYIDFFNNMAHELRTPLTNVGLAIKRLVSKQPALNHDPYLEIAIREKNKLNDQLERVLNVAKLENGDYRMKKEPVLLNELINDILDDMKLQILEYDAQVIIDPAIADFTIIGDQVHLRHAFRNIIDNSIKYCDTNPVIRIFAKPSPGSISVIFADNGIGISKHHQKLVFKKFHRIYDGNLHERKGFGLGLAYVKMIIEKHKGTIRITSEKNKGSKFELSLPS